LENKANNSFIKSSYDNDENWIQIQVLFPIEFAEDFEEYIIDNAFKSNNQ